MFATTGPITPSASFTLGRRFSHDGNVPAVPTPTRSASFVSQTSRRSGIVSEQDALKLLTAMDDGLRRSPSASVLPPDVSSRNPPIPPRRTPVIDRRRLQPLTNGVTASRRLSTPVGVDYQTVDNRNIQNGPAWQPPRTRPAVEDVNWSNHATSTVKPGQQNNDPRLVQPPPVNGKLRHYPDSLEGLLAEREAELRNLRQTMERNEQAILQALDDQRRVWEAETEEKVREWQLRFCGVEEETRKKELSLLGRIERLELENSALRAEVDLAKDINCKERYARDLIRNTSSRTSIRSCSSSDPVTSVEHKMQNRSEFGSPCLENPVVSARQENVSLQAVVEGQFESVGSDTDTKCTTSPSASVFSPTASTLEEQGKEADVVGQSNFHCCQSVRQQLELTKSSFEAERQQWLREKETVIDYQKLLQFSYLQLVRRCAELEDQLRRVGCQPEDVSGEMRNGRRRNLVPATLAAWSSSTPSSSSSSSVAANC